MGRSDATEVGVWRKGTSVVPEGLGSLSVRPVSRLRGSSSLTDDDQALLAGKGQANHQPIASRLIKSVREEAWQEFIANWCKRYGHGNAHGSQNLVSTISCAARTTHCTNPK